jgi:hypothetical protein
LAAVIRERSSEILASWIVQFERSLLRFRRQAKAATHTAQVANLVEALSVAVSGGSAELKPGAHATRELERSAAFLGAQFASEGATGFDISALLLELRDVVAAMADREDAAALTRLFEWLTTVALETGTPVIEVVPKVPAVLLVGAPNAATLDSLLSRAWMLAVGTGAPCLIIDCGGLAEPAEKNFEAGYRSFLEQAAGSALQVLLSSGRRPLRERAEAQTAERGLSFQHFERFDSAVAHAIERAGYLLMKRS